MELDKDLAARQEARLLCRQAEKAQQILAQMTQQQLDAIVEAIAGKFSASAVELAELAVRETGFGNAEDKVVKNRFASETVAAAVRGMKTVGVLNTCEKENYGRWVCRWGSLPPSYPAPIPPPQFATRLSLR